MSRHDNKDGSENRVDVTNCFGDNARQLGDYTDQEGEQGLPAVIDLEEILGVDVNADYLGEGVSRRRAVRSWDI